MSLNCLLKNSKFYIFYMYFTKYFGNAYLIHEGVETCGKRGEKSKRKKKFPASCLHLSARGFFVE